MFRYKGGREGGRGQRHSVQGGTSAERSTTGAQCDAGGPCHSTVREVTPIYVTRTRVKNRALP